MYKPDIKKLAAVIDHTCLKPDATAQEIEKLCQEAKTYQFQSVCVNSGWVGYCAKLLKASNIKICSTVGFPLGAMHPLSKRYEAAQAIREGAAEIDMVISIGALKSQDLSWVTDDIHGVVEVCGSGVISKIIIETGLLTEKEKYLACRLVKESGASFVKTSTGFAGKGATIEDVALLRSLIGPDRGVKASGGIRQLDQALAMLEAGATRLGTSAGVGIIETARKQL
jgi:deoxyribose-phosphate aldolase